MGQQRVNWEQTPDGALEHELDEALEALDLSREDDPDFSEWYLNVRRECGEPSDEAREYLLNGDLATFEKLMRADRTPTGDLRPDEGVLLEHGGVDAATDATRDE